LKDLSALYRNQHPRGSGSSGTMICVNLKALLLDIAESLWFSPGTKFPTPA